MKTPLELAKEIEAMIGGVDSHLITSPYLHVRREALSNLAALVSEHVKVLELSAKAGPVEVKGHAELRAPEEARAVLECEFCKTEYPTPANKENDLCPRMLVHGKNSFSVCAGRMRLKG